MIDVYSCGYECKLNSIKGKSVVLTGEGIAEIFEVTEENQEIQIVERNIRGEIYLTAYPVIGGKLNENGMMGGRFVYSSDSRFRTISAYPVPLHDRFER